jgi:hypothetical protein
MTRRLFVLILASLALMGGVLFGIFQRNQSRLVRLEGSVTQVRLRALSDGATLAILDFEARNPSPARFELEDIAVDALPPVGDPVRGGLLARTELRGYMDYEKLPQAHPLLGIGAVTAPGETLRGIVAARFEPGQAPAGSRFRVLLRDIHNRTSTLESQPMP